MDIPLTFFICGCTLECGWRSANGIGETLSKLAPGSTVTITDALFEMVDIAQIDGRALLCPAGSRYLASYGDDEDGSREFAGSQP